MLLDWQDLGVRVIFTRDAEHTARYCRGLREKYTSRDATEPMRIMKSPNGTNKKLGILLDIPLVGPKLAQRLVDRHGGKWGVFQHYVKWPISRLEKQDGKGLAHKVLKAMDRVK